MRAVILVLLGLICAVSSFAQEPEEVVIEFTEFSPMVMHLDPVLVSRFQADDGLEGQAERVRTVLQQQVEESFVSIDLKDVPRFENYGADMYLRSCPKTELVGCAYVIGARAQADWVITGTVNRQIDDGEIILDDEESEEPVGGPLAIQIHILDIRDSRVALAFEAMLTPETEQFFAKTVVGIVTKLVAGEGQLADLRGKFDDPVVEAERKKLEAAIMASSLSDLERELGGLVQRESGRVEVPKLTQADLDAYDDRDDIPPWELVNMAKKEYLRYKNSKKNIFEWRLMKKGRQGQVLLAASVPFGIDMYEHWFDGRWALDKSDLTVVEVDEWQAVKVGPGAGVDFSIGVGFLPQLDLSVDIGFRAANFYSVTHKEVVEQPLVVEEPSQKSVYTFRVGASVTYAPKPTWKLRPTITAGMAMWKGKAVQLENTPLEALPAPTLILVNAAPGGEFSLNNHMVVFARVNFSFLVGGNRVETHHLFEENKLSTMSEPIGGWAPGIQGVLGLQVRVGPFTKKRNPLE